MYMYVMCLGKELLRYIYDDYRNIVPFEENNCIYTITSLNMNVIENITLV